VAMPARVAFLAVWTDGRYLPPLTTPRIAG
jgi:hypothetical protein